ncbi:hypothetical protein WA158_001560 [Blastocystis sp. Blastoise]
MNTTIEKSPEVSEDADTKTPEVIDIEIKEQAPKKDVKNDMPCCEKESNWFSWVSVHFLQHIFKIGSKRTLTQEDLGGFNPRDDPHKLYDRFEENYILQEQFPKEKRSLFGPILKATGVCEWVLAILAAIIQFAFTFIPTLVMQQLVSDLQNPEDGEHLRI